MAERIATIKLNSGQGGFYDDLTNIHLTVANPVAHLYAGQNFTNIRKGIAVGHLILTEGTLGPDPRPYRLVRVGNHLEIDLRPEALSKKAGSKKNVDVVLKDAKKETPAEAPAQEEKLGNTDGKAAESPKTEEDSFEQAAAEAETSEKKPAKKASAKKTFKKDTKKADEE